MMSAKRIVLLIMALSGGALLFGQSEEKPPEKKEVLGWSNTLASALNLTQNHHNGNWVRGGEESVSWRIKLNTVWENNRERVNWKNTAKLTYGQIKKGDLGARKISDELELESLLVYKAGKRLHPFFAFNAETQIATGYEYAKDGSRNRLSQFLDPGYLRQSVGLIYQVEKTFSWRAGVALHEFVQHSYSSNLAKEEHGFDLNAPPPADFSEAELELFNNLRTRASEKVHFLPGFESTANLAWKIEKNVLLKSKLDFFAEFDDVSAIYSTWDNELIVKISKLFSVNLDVDFIFDPQHIDAVQLRQIFSFGINYTFF